MINRQMLMKSQVQMSVPQKGSCYRGQTSKTRIKLYYNSGGDTKEPHCPCTIGNRSCTLFCKCFNCGKRPPRNNHIDNQSSCRCGANNKNDGEEVKSCTDTTGKRRTKCNCYIESGHVPISAVVMGAAMSMEEDKPAMFPQRKKETLNAPQAHQVYKGRELTNFLQRTTSKLSKGLGQGRRHI